MANKSKNYEENSQVKHFVFTFFPKENYGLLEFENKLKELETSYYIIGEEICPSTNRLHYQGYAEIKNKKRLNTLKKHLQCFCDGRRGSLEEAMDYCKKDKKFIESGEPETLNQQTQKELCWKESINLAKRRRLDTLAESHPSLFVRYHRTWNQIAHDHTDLKTPTLRRGLWLWSKNPGTGKSRWCHSKFPEAYWKSCSTFWQGYQGQDVVIFDDFDTSCTKLAHELKRWVDGYPLIADVKNSHCVPMHSKFIITSNYKPDDLWTDERIANAIKRRFLIYEVIKWSDNENDILIKIENKIFPTYLSYLLFNYDFF